MLQSTVFIEITDHHHIQTVIIISKVLQVWLAYDLNLFLYNRTEQFVHVFPVQARKIEKEKKSSWTNCLAD